MHCSYYKLSVDLRALRNSGIQYGRRSTPRQNPIGLNGGAEKVRTKNARLENVAPKRMGGNCESEACGIILQGGNGRVGKRRVWEEKRTEEGRGNRWVAKFPESARVR